MSKFVSKFLWLYLNNQVGSRRSHVMHILNVIIVKDTMGLSFIHIFQNFTVRHQLIHTAQCISYYSFIHVKNDNKIYLGYSLRVEKAEFRRVT